MAAGRWMADLVHPVGDLACKVQSLADPVGDRVHPVDNLACKVKSLAREVESAECEVVFRSFWRSSGSGASNRHGSGGWVSKSGKNRRWRKGLELAGKVRIAECRVESAGRKVWRLARKVQSAEFWTFDLAGGVRNLACKGFDLAEEVGNLACKGFDLADPVGGFERSTWRTAGQISVSGSGSRLRGAGRCPLTPALSPDAVGGEEGAL